MFKIITIDELLKILDKYNHKELHVHHTWEPDHSNFNGSNGIKLQENMRAYHLSKGWSDIGQHVTLLPDGTFVTGRDFAKTPASIEGHNIGGFACEMLGNFDIGHDKLEGKQRESIIKLAQYFNKKGRYIRFHRENSPKTCPGTSIDKDAFMKEVRGQQSLPTPILKQGDKGEDVANLQRALNKYSYKLIVNGIFDSLVLGAVKDFQKAHSLMADGIVGPKTWNELRR